MKRGRGQLQEVHLEVLRRHQPLQVATRVRLEVGAAMTSLLHLMTMNGRRKDLAVTRLTLMHLQPRLRELLRWQHAAAVAR